ncbi:MAG: hypothetical protein KGH63_02020, partial [Candidatus Micrarchaeota archaeon]|nr:hypothetical protein [Candidatus Micrarchaeota archaeon]
SAYHKLIDKVTVLTGHFEIIYHQGLTSRASSDPVSLLIASSSFELSCIKLEPYPSNDIQSKQLDLIENFLNQTSDLMDMVDIANREGRFSDPATSRSLGIIRETLPQAQQMLSRMKGSSPQPPPAPYDRPFPTS